MKQIELRTGLALEEVLAQAREETVVLMRGGHAVAMVSEIDDDELYWLARERDPAFLESIERGREQAKARNSIHHEELRRRIGLDGSP